jgi:hypothetical protein
MIPGSILTKVMITFYQILILVVIYYGHLHRRVNSVGKTMLLNILETICTY